VSWIKKAHKGSSCPPSANSNAKPETGVVELFRNQLHYDYLGNWEDRPNNRNSEPGCQSRQGCFPRHQRASVDRFAVMRYSVVMKKRFIGRYVVTDPRICHGQPTFRGTRILVSDVLEQVASGMDWQAIIEEWRGGIGERAISEAVRLASEALSAQAGQLAAETAAA